MTRSATSVFASLDAMTMIMPSTNELIIDASAIAVIGALYLAGLIKKVVIVAPLSIVGVWLEEFQKFADFDYTAIILEGSSSKKTDTLRHMTGSSLQVIILNYESAWRLEDELLKFNADIIVADEGHKIKTHNAKQSKAVHKLGAKALYKMLLTGTVITNKAIDVFSQYKFINPAIFGQSFYVFRNKYFDMVGYGNHTPILKRSMEQDLTDKLHSIAFRTTKAECLDLPETTDIIRFVELEANAANIYKDLLKDSFAELSKGEVTVTNVLTRLLRLSQLTGGFIGDDNSVGGGRGFGAGGAAARLGNQAHEVGKGPRLGRGVHQGAGAQLVETVGGGLGGGNFLHGLLLWPALLQKPFQSSDAVISACYRDFGAEIPAGPGLRPGRNAPGRACGRRG